MGRPSWTTVKFGAPVVLLWAFDFILYKIYMLDRVETLEYQMLSWFISLTIGMVMISYILLKFQAVPTYTETSKQRILTFTMFGFIAVMGIFFLLQLVVDLAFRFDVLGLEGLDLLLGVTAAINEEIFRWALLRSLGFFLPKVPFVKTKIGSLGLLDVYAAGIVNTIWVFFHVKSYVTAPSIAWASLWFAGMIITIAMWYSQHIAVAIGIHSLWNIAVIVNFSVLGAAVGVII